MGQTRALWSAKVPVCWDTAPKIHANRDCQKPSVISCEIAVVWCPMLLRTRTNVKYRTRSLDPIETTPTTAVLSCEGGSFHNKRIQVGRPIDWSMAGNWKVPRGYWIWAFKDLLTWAKNEESYPKGCLKSHLRRSLPQTSLIPVKCIPAFWCSLSPTSLPRRSQCLLCVAWRWYLFIWGCKVFVKRLGAIEIQTCKIHYLSDGNL